jgi:hypothetical protein
MSLKHLLASTVLALAAVIGASGLAAHASPSAARAMASASTTCQTTVLQQVPLTGHNTTHGYAYLLRDLCDGNVFLQVSTDLWGSYVTASLTYGDGSRVTAAGNLTWGGHVDTAEVPYTSASSYGFDGYATGFWGDTYYGGGLYTAP